MIFLPAVAALIVPLFVRVLALALIVMLSLEDTVTPVLTVVGVPVIVTGAPLRLMVGVPVTAPRVNAPVPPAPDTLISVEAFTDVIVALPVCAPWSSGV